MRSRNREQSLSLFVGAGQRNRQATIKRKRNAIVQCRAAKQEDGKRFLAPLCSVLGHMFALVFPSPAIRRRCSNEGVSPGLPQADDRKQLPGSTGWQAGYLVRRVLGTLADTRELTI